MFGWLKRLFEREKISPFDIHESIRRDFEGRNRGTADSEAKIIQCSECRFYSDEDHHDSGDCRRHAPIAVMDETTPSGYDRYTRFVMQDEKRLYIRSIFPSVKTVDSCGDFEPK